MCGKRQSVWCRLALPSSDGTVALAALNGHFLFCCCRVCSRCGSVTLRVDDTAASSGWRLYTPLSRLSLSFRTHSLVRWVVASVQVPGDQGDCTTFGQPSVLCVPLIHLITTFCPIMVAKGNRQTDGQTDQCHRVTETID